MHKPILYLVLFFGIDLAMNALLYKTEETGRRNSIRIG
jgi:MscS family membrane protein